MRDGGVMALPALEFARHRVARRRHDACTGFRRMGRSQRCVLALGERRADQAVVLDTARGVCRAQIHVGMSRRAAAPGLGYTAELC